ncbi:D(2) dopamine receptor A-like [Strongylocentrotus purpuratus]|uniref:G-protein coupled receptors family 1 profile domain-containing protein n=1 Tax=Strongylocentrotus purpuratus TaxID=7668 RepID=A0A7M7P2F4_STRPU|nr:D(2) dopamine receptor A-like [Strongylocentrotus purpuratus]
MMDHYNLTTDIPEVQQDISYVRYVLVSVFFLPCAIVIFVENTFVLLAYKRDKRIRRNTTNAYILNLAVSDLLVSVVMAIYVPVYLTGTWKFGGASCVVLWVLDYTATDMSVMTIIVISVDRYLMVHNSLRHRSRQSHKKVAIICSILWITCLAAHSTLAFTYSSMTGFMHDENRIAGCELGYGHSPVVLVLMFLVEFLVPAICVFALNLTVYFRLKRRSNMLQTRQSRSHLSTAVPLNDRASQTTSWENDGMRIHGSASGSQHQKAARFLALLLIVFIFCWLPFYINECYAFLYCSGVHNEALTDLVSYIMWINSAINPFLYAFTNVFFKENFKQFLKCK